MAVVDFTITDAEYNQMMAVLNAMRSRLATMKLPLQRMMRQETGRAKIKAFATTDNGRFLREVRALHDDVVNYFEQIGWK